MCNWKSMIEEEFNFYGDTWDCVVSHTFEGSEMEDVFDCGWGLSEGVRFTLWTHNRVYFPVCYDGAEWVGSVSRHPDGKATAHQGGE